MNEAPSGRPPERGPESDAEPPPEAYISYIHRFFHVWLPVYDWFARSIFWVYRTTVEKVGAGPGVTVLDVCTGTGEIALRCARRGAEVTGVDITPEMLAKGMSKAARSEKTRGVRFEVMDARSLDFPDKSFDVAVISFALHDMPRKVRLQVLREAKRVVRDRLVILDYDLPAGAMARRVTTSLISIFETAYFRNFAREGVLPLLFEAGIVDEPGTHLRVSRHLPPFFSTIEIDRTS